MSEVPILAYAVCVLFALVCLLLPPIRLTLKRFFLFLFLLFHGPAFFLYCADTDWSESSTKMAGILTCGLCGFGLGVVLAREPLAKLQWPAGNVLPVRLNKLFFWGLVVLVASVAVGELFVRGKGANLLTFDKESVLSGDYMAFRLEQSLLSRDLLSTAFAYLCQFGFGGFVALLTLAIAVQRRSLVLILLASGLVALILLSKLSAMQKIPGVFFLLQVGLLGLLLRRGEVKAVRLSVVVGVLTLGLLVPVYLRLTEAENLADASGYILQRLTYVPNVCLEELCGPFPEATPHTFGLNIRLVHSLFGSGEYRPVHSGEAGGTSNAIFLADAWVDFGWYGVAAYSFLVGVLLTRLDYFLFRKKNTLRIAMFVGLMGPVSSLISTSLISCLGGFGLLPILVCGLMLERDWNWNGALKLRAGRTAKPGDQS